MKAKRMKMKIKAKEEEKRNFNQNEFGERTEQSVHKTTTKNVTRATASEKQLEL